MKDLDYLSKEEMYSLLKHLQANTKYPAARQVYKHTLKFFDDKRTWPNDGKYRSELLKIGIG